MTIDEYKQLLDNIDRAKRDKKIDEGNRRRAFVRFMDGERDDDGKSKKTPKPKPSAVPASERMMPIADSVIFVVGIDTGKNTGFAVWDRRNQELFSINTYPIHVAMLKLKELRDSVGKEAIHVRFEDARLRDWYGDDANKKMQGAGSVKRDSKIWEDYLEYLGLRYDRVAPKENRTKLKEEPFARLTGWTKRSSEHGRDAAMMVINIK